MPFFKDCPLNINKQLNVHILHAYMPVSSTKTCQLNLQIYIHVSLIILCLNPQKSSEGWKYSINFIISKCTTSKCAQSFCEISGISIENCRWITQIWFPLSPSTQNITFIIKAGVEIRSTAPKMVSFVNFKRYEC